MRTWERALLLLLAAGGAARADELSGADKLRVLYSSQFAWTRQGLPLVTVRIAEGLKEVRVRGALRVLPDGEMGAEVSGGQDWTVRLVGESEPARQRYHVVVARAPVAEAHRLQEEASTWRQRGFQPRMLEVGAVFGIRGEVIDMRHLLLTVAPQADEAAARQKAQELSERYQVAASVHLEPMARPQGVVQARDERGTLVRNSGVLWFAPLEGTLRVDPPGRSYWGQIYVALDRSGALAVVNAVPEDRLLMGLLPAEMSPQAPLEALKAQAVAARNQLLAKIGIRHMGDPYRLCADTHCQVYAGAGQERPRTTQAVEQTRGELLVAGPAAAETLVDTVYSASCGGHTEDNDLAWGTRPDPMLRGRLDLPAAEVGRLTRFAGRIGEAEVGDFLRWDAQPRPLCARTRSGQAYYRWTVRVKAETILERAGPGLGSLRDVSVLQRGVSGRAVLLRLQGSTGSRQVQGELEIRRVLGGLRSALFVLLPQRRGQDVEAIEVQGGGFGHGVGLCQQGAMALAEEGRTYREILEHYYPGGRLRRLY
ncbi:MAG: SpoIID/LytB domain-containing protein [Myxococcota bacterium]|nr:SpoIID/LytB domain-containing protein [Myxococcota bacterium]